ncbi:MAG: ribosomal RNA small subunit methyltransferase A [Candidatus Cloacimonetes bacterium HGW-Cloacimonetes-1]|jgi:16S rRNA (adenine1518-N6/adenine1519-N6)-dimethyltransferase|nr:MAG: ribosomal RNA small subunit methyltransferase A [Candidatus Cloacimonetes bacterium HGW-Cloacimonetes-1]
MGFKKLKDFGQHFLNDSSIATDMVREAVLKPGDKVWEVGPGLGVLTAEIIQSGAELTAFEIDRRLKIPLTEQFGSDLNLVMSDILSVNWESELSTYEPQSLKLVANIPYQITSPLLYELEKHAKYFKCIVMMVQKEVAQRLTARPSTKEYGQMTLRLKMQFDTEILFIVGKEKFDPPPKVDSAIIIMRMRKSKPQIKDIDTFYKLIHAAFLHRRKTLRNNLSGLVSKDKLDILEHESDIELSRRGETLSEEEFIHLSDCITML